MLTSFKPFIKLLSCLCFVVWFCAACNSPTYEMVTKQVPEYRYALGETAEILEEDATDVIATLTIDSCELISDEPFIALVPFEQEPDEDDLEYNEMLYTALYKISYSFSDKYDFATNTNEHFYSVDPNFRLNPTDKKIGNRCFYVGVLSGNNNDNTISLSFKYDNDQNEPTALFDIKVDKVVVESSLDEHSSDIKRIKVKNYYPYTALNTQNDSKDDSKDKSSASNVFLTSMAAFGAIVILSSVIFLAISTLVVFLIIKIIKFIISYIRKKNSNKEI